MSQPQRVIIGFITYGAATARYLPQFLAGLKDQTFGDWLVMAYDNSPKEDNSNREILERWGNIKIFSQGKNLGFAAAANLLLKEARQRGAEYFWLINPDTLLDQAALENLVRVMDERPEVAVVSPKVLQWNFAEQTKTKIIDTCGLRLAAGLRFYDVGQGEIDNGQYDGAAIIGPSGCAGLWRLGALEQIKDEAGNYFDENFFMYKEDCDLAYRLRLAGLAAVSVPSAIIYHDRTVSATLRRGQRSRQEKIWSWRGQNLLFKKYWHSQNLLNKVIIIIRQLVRYGYAILFERYLLKN